MRRILIIIVVVAAAAGTAALLLPAPRPGDGAGRERGARGAAPLGVALVRIAGTFDQPVYVAAPRGNASLLFVVEKTGRIRIVKDGAVLARPFLDLSGAVSSDGERGLLSVAFDPRYASNRRFYVDYTNTAGDTRVVRYTASARDSDRASTASSRVLLRIHQPYSNHNGGQLQFGPDGRLYVGMGDGGSEGDPQGRAQNPQSRLGKMLRLSVGTSPVKVEVYAKGLRNPWRFSFDRATGALWIGDVGQNKWEEVDYLKPGRPVGANLGWNGYEGTHVYDAAVAAALNKRTLTWPVSQYSHSLGEAVTGGYVYRGSAIPSLRGFYVFGDYATGHVWAMKGPDGTRFTLPGADLQVAHISSFGQDAAGELYVVDIAGSVYRIAPAP